MEIRRYTYVDVHYNPDEQKKADKIQRQLEKRGYEISDRDAGGAEYEYTDQYIKYFRFLKK